MTTIGLVNANQFRKDGHTHDRNGKQNLFLTPIAGKIPSKCMVMSGTLSENLGIELGKTYLLSFNEGKADPQYGRQFSTTNLGEVSVMDTLTVIERLGDAVIVDVTAAGPTPVRTPEPTPVKDELPVND